MMKSEGVVGWGEGGGMLPVWNVDGCLPIATAFIHLFIHSFIFHLSINRYNVRMWK